MSMPPENSTVDMRARTRWLEDQSARRRVDEPPGPPHDGDMERRVASLETDLKEIKADLKALVKDAAEIKGRVSQIPTTFQVLTWFVAVAIGLTALVFTIAKTVASH